MAHVGLGCFDKIGNEVIASLELYLDLRKAVFMAILQFNQLVVDACDPKSEQRQDDENNDHFHGKPLGSARLLWSRHDALSLGKSKKPLALALFSRHIETPDG